VLPARLQDYDGAWLDSLCLSGRVFWARLDHCASPTAGPVRATPIALLTRSHRALWQRLSAEQMQAPQLSASAAAMAEVLQRHGASFFDEIVQGAGLLQAQAESGLAELVAAGLVSADSFGGLRALLLPLARKRKLAARARRAGLSGLSEAGRWSLVRRAQPAVASVQATADAGEPSALVEQLVWLLLRRYGVLFRRLLTREAQWLPPWHMLLRACRRLEAQGHIRGGRFVAGVSGEQYALSDAIGPLRAVRKRPPAGAWVALSAADPLNLAGIVTPGPRLAALAGNRLVMRDGVPVASYAGGEVQYHTQMPPHEQWQVRNALLRKLPTAPLAQIG